MAVATKAKAKKSIAAVRPTKKAVITKAKVLGTVTHYYDHLNVAIIEVNSSFRLGELVIVRHGTFQFVQPVTSLQLDHLPVSKTKKGDSVGMRIMHKVAEGATVEAV